MPNADIVYYPNFIALAQSNLFFNRLLQEVPWQQDEIIVYGKNHQQPRLTALYGNEGKPYAYSNIIMHPHPWNSLLTYIKEEVEKICETQFTTVLLNLYRDGKDSNGWHSDNEKELGRNPIIASLSLGAERMFHLKHNQQTELRQRITLQNGSLLVMKGETQHFWKHQIPKTEKEIGKRINLTFRIIK